MRTLKLFVGKARLLIHYQLHISGNFTKIKLYRDRDNLSIFFSFFLVNSAWRHSLLAVYKLHKHE